MITREDVADLQPGDVVEMTWRTHDNEVEHSVRGPLWSFGDQGLRVGEFWVLEPNGKVIEAAPRRTLTVVSRAPRPLYVNHPRTEPSCGDVFQPEFSQWPIWVAGHDRIAEHKSAESCRWIGLSEMPARLRLLVDGETGRCVP